MKNNLEGLVNEMLNNMHTFKDPTFIKNVFQTIIEMCTNNDYENITNFEWLITHVVFSLAKHKEPHFDRKLSFILTDIALKLEDVRQKAITGKCYAELKDNIKDYIILSKDVYSCLFVESMLYIVCENIEDLNLTAA